jgi:hypothetical protein
VHFGALSTTIKRVIVGTHRTISAIWQIILLRTNET